MKKTDLVNHSYVSFVNLDHRTDRLKRMEESLAEINLKAVRTRGLKPDEVQVDPKRVEVMRKRTPGAIGCHFAQVSVMEQALRMGAHAWVMEDDLIFCDDFWFRIVGLEKFCDENPWDILWLGATFHVNPPYWHKDTLGRDAECTLDPHVMRTYGAFCTYAYIVNKDSIAKVLEGLDRLLDKSIGIDWAMIQLQPHLRTYAYVPGCVTQYDNRSDIGNGMTVFSNFGKEIPWFFARNARNFDVRSHDWKEAKL